MERIKQALERARAEREQTHLHGSRPDHLVRSAPAAHALSHEAGAITYTQTQQIEVSDRRLRRRRVIAAIDDAPLAAAYKVLRTQLLHRLRLHDWTTVAITSPSSGDGKTLTAVNLAVALAKEVNHTVLLVDMDLRQPSVNSHFDFQPKLGVSDYLLRDAALPQMLFTPGVNGLVILPGHEHVAQSSEAMSSPRMVQLVQELKTRYPSRIVLFDVPPLLSGDDTIAFAPLVDSVLLVAREGKTRMDDLATAAELLRETPILGTVINESQERVETYY